MNHLRDMWAGLDNMGRVVFVACIAVVLIAAMALGLDLSWIPEMLGAK
jgi:hypothetical protein